MAVNDNPSLVTLADPTAAALPTTAPPLLVQAGFSGQTDNYVAPTPLALLAGAEGTRALTLVGSDVGQVSLPVATPADPFGANADAAVAAGAAGSLSAKLRRLTADIGGLVGALASGATDYLRVRLFAGTDQLTAKTVGAEKALCMALVDLAGNQITSLAGTSSPATATLSNIATSTASAQLVASNVARKGLRVFNDSAQLMYLKFGATASSTSHTDQIDPKSTWIDKDGYTGRVDAILDANTGTARVTELT